MKTILEFLGVIRSLIVFLVLAMVLLWLLMPVIPGVHGFWDDILQILGLFGFFELVKWMRKSVNKKSADKTT